MVSACIYLEGGAKGPDSKFLTIACQQAFHKLLDSMGFTDRKPKLVACGGRGSVFERFCTAHKSGTCDYVAMWIDSEEPMADIEQPVGAHHDTLSIFKPGGTGETTVVWKTSNRALIA